LPPLRLRKTKKTIEARTDRITTLRNVGGTGAPGGSLPVRAGAAAPSASFAS
jgi:hypothetical protein